MLRTMRKNCILWQDLCKFTLKKKRYILISFEKKIATLQSALKFRAQLFKGRISASASVKFNLGFIFCSKAFSRTIFSDVHGASNHQLVDKKN